MTPHGALFLWCNGVAEETARLVVAFQINIELATYELRTHSQ